MLHPDAHLAFPQKRQTVVADKCLAGSDYKCPVTHMGVLLQKLLRCDAAQVAVEPLFGEVQLGLCKGKSS